MKPYTSNIQDLTISNDHFRKVLFTGKKMQLVVMSLKPKEEIGFEIHNDVDQFFRVESGEAKVIAGDEEFIIKDDEVAIVPAGYRHNVINTSSTQDLKLYTIYTPPEHPDGTIHHTKADTPAHDH